MLKAPCPSCGGELEFKSQTTILCVCTYCRSNIIRHDSDLELIGKQSDLMEDMSPIQIGCYGKYKNKSFQVVGRQILGWSDGRWIEWYILFNNGTGGWLAEAQGEFFITFPPKEPSSAIRREGDNLFIGRTRYERVDKKYVTCLGSEGELPFRAIEGRSSTVYDYSDFKGGFASLETSDDEELQIYSGYVTSLKKLHMKGLKRFEGWGRFE